MNSIIFMTEKNIHGAWVIYGMLGVRQYYDYTKKEAEAMYVSEYNRTYVTAQTR